MRTEIRKLEKEREIRGCKIAHSISTFDGEVMERNEKAATLHIGLD